ncbi:MAG: DoxX family protein [Candidatus Omnitrophota bacterium]|jgi:putative oxidoreductase|nr:MAG: DoxX family protein [Candidatus Omnitrophota bacterium]
MLEKWMANYSSLALLILRATIGIIFFAHGGQKLFGFFGGTGIAGTVETFSTLPIVFPALMAWIVSGIELFGGIALIIGILTREFSLLLAMIMFGAIWTVHGPNGFFMANNGFEYNFALLGGCLSLAFSGGGALSLDVMFFPKPKWTFVKDPSQFKLEPPAE